MVLEEVQANDVQFLVACDTVPEVEAWIAYQPAGAELPKLPLQVPVERDESILL